MTAMQTVCQTTRDSRVQVESRNGRSTQITRVLAWYQGVPFAGAASMPAGLNSRAALHQMIGLQGGNRIGVEVTCRQVQAFLSWHDRSRFHDN